jgi:hypothetical protein
MCFRYASGLSLERKTFHARDGPEKATFLWKGTVSEFGAVSIFAPPEILCIKMLMSTAYPQYRQYLLRGTSRSCDRRAPLAVKSVVYNYPTSFHTHKMCSTEKSETRV